MGSRQPGRAGDGRARLSARRSWTSTKLSGGERRRVALCQLCSKSLNFCCSTSRPTISTPRPLTGWKGQFAQLRGRDPDRDPRSASLDNVTGFDLELDRGRGIPHEGNYTSYLKQKAKRLALEKSEDSARQKQIEMEAEWMGSSPRERQAKSKARIQRYQDLRRQAGQPRAFGHPDRHSGGRAADRMSSSSQACPKASATSC